ncbi:MAG: rRNA maturation RNase YbeY [Anaerolineaceae bacterium]
MIEIQIAEAFQPALDGEILSQTIQAALKHQHAPEDAELTVVVDDDEAVHTLNRDFRGVDDTTDVLSFPADEVDPESGHPYLGDIIISYPQASRQAAAGGHSIQAELQLLVVHGVLHLLGHDHAEADEKERMWSAQSEILSQLGSPLTSPRE